MFTVLVVIATGGVVVLAVLALAGIVLETLDFRRAYRASGDSHVR